MKRNILAGAIILVSFSAAVAIDTDPSLDELEFSVGNLKKQQKNTSVADQPRIKQQIEEKLAQLEKVGDAKPMDEKIQTDLARRFININEPPRALNRADKAVALAPQDPEARVVRAQSYYKLGRYEEAAADAATALELDPKNKQAEAVLRLSSGRSSGASANKAASGMPSGAWAGAGKGAAAAGGIQGLAGSNKIVGSQEQTDRLKAADLFGQAAGRLGLGDRAAAIALLDKAIALDPKSAPAYLARGKAKLGADDKKSAIAAVADAERAAALAPHSAAARLLLAQSQEKAGFPQGQVLAAYKAAAELDASLTEDYQSALARWSGGAPGASDARAEVSAAAAGAADLNGTGAEHRRSGPLPEPIRKALPWATVVLILLGGSGVLLARKKGS